MRFSLFALARKVAELVLKRDQVAPARAGMNRSASQPLWRTARVDLVGLDRLSHSGRFLNR